MWKITFIHVFEGVDSESAIISFFTVLGGGRDVD